jgi:hypothetical protein
MEVVQLSVLLYQGEGLKQPGTAAFACLSGRTIPIDSVISKPALGDYH